MSLKRNRPTDNSPAQDSNSDLGKITVQTNADVKALLAANLTVPGDIDVLISLFSDQFVTNDTKTLVRLREQDKCWLCGFKGLHAGHVVACTDVTLISSYIAQGLLKADFDPNALENLMLLCAGCYHNFDARTPIWVFLPADLQYFIEQEQHFQNRRNEAAAKGSCLQRENKPNEEIYYTRYLVRSGFISPILFQQTPDKTWAGNAVASIIRSQSIISGHARLPESEGGVPKSTMDMLYRLFRLYATPQPTPAVPFGLTGAGVPGRYVLQKRRIAKLRAKQQEALPPSPKLEGMDDEPLYDSNGKIRRDMIGHLKRYKLQLSEEDPETPPPPNDTTPDPHGETDEDEDDN